MRDLAALARAIDLQSNGPNSPNNLNHPNNSKSPSKNGGKSKKKHAIARPDSRLLSAAVGYRTREEVKPK